jgi:vacuolar-type H+-ATPase subunit H
MSEPPIVFDPQQVAPFLEKIARKRDSELSRITRERDAEMARILGDAYREARHLFRRSVQDTRDRLQQEQDRYLARVRSELRRERWKILKSTQAQAVEAIWQRFLQAWDDPSMQLLWCRYWVTQALERAGELPLTVVCGAGAAAETVKELAVDLRQHAAGGEVRSDDGLEPGLVVEWGDYTLDGRLRAQRSEIADRVLSRVAHLMSDDPDPESAE